MYDKDFKNVVEIGQNYSVLTTSGVEKYFECVYVEPLPASNDLVEDFGAIDSGSVSRANKVDILEMEGSAKVETDISEIAQLRFYPLDDIAINVKQPAANGRFKTKNDDIRVDFNTIELDPSLKSTEIFVYEDDVPYFDVYNLTNYTLPKTRVQFYGWRIVGSQLARQPDKLAYIVASSYQG